jgi:hypothetical protein
MSIQILLDCLELKMGSNLSVPNQELDKFCDVPIMWVSKMQTQIALSTMEAEYIALSQTMRYLIRIREILEEIMLEVLEKNSSQSAHHTPKHS